MKYLLILLCLFSFLEANPLQDAIDLAKPYATIKLSSAIYKGNITITKPITILGVSDDVIIEGEGVGSVITILSSYVILKNITIINSGKRMGKINSAISMRRVKSCKIDSCVMRDVLYGIDMDMVSESIISNNTISSYPQDISLRGDALKLYYASNNLFTNNTITNSRDVTLNYSHNNRFEHNSFLHNRFASHLSLSNNNIFDNNTYKYNSVSIMVMGAKNTTLRHNTIESSNGAAGIGVLIRGVMNFRFERNRVRYNAKALYIDGAEKAKGMKRYINYNEISYNKEAIHFHVKITDNTITHNDIFSNIDDVVKDTAGNFRDSNLVEYNYWDRYAGFDRDGDNIGDSHFQIYQYADQLWHYNNKVKFFYASPIMSLMNFLANLAPFIEPNLLLEDSKPLMSKNKE